ncbi:MAG: hypothetical protein LBJ63_11165 [Prevotellaceae bacterium]|nr:hypothetical protein [Prevotellaceae bacterium]
MEEVMSYVIYNPEDYNTVLSQINANLEHRFYCFCKLARNKRSVSEIIRYINQCDIIELELLKFVIKRGETDELSKKNNKGNAL